MKQRNPIPAASPTDALQVPSGGSVALLVSSYDPPVPEYLEVLEALSRYSGVTQAWMTPVHGGEDVVGACNLMANSLATKGVQVAVCTLGVDSSLSHPDDVFELCKSKIPYVSPRMAYLACEYPERVPKEDEILVFPQGYRPKPCKFTLVQNFPVSRQRVQGSLLDSAKRMLGSQR